jgi:hypothetical protein
MHGLINQNNYERLMTRLDSLCGISIHQRSKLMFKRWEAVHTTSVVPLSSVSRPTSSSSAASASASATATATATTITATSSTAVAAAAATTTTGTITTSNAPKELADLVVVHEYNTRNNTWECKHIKYLGKSLASTRDRQLRTLVRPVQYGHIYSNNALDFLNLIQCELNYEYVKKGFRYMARNNIEIEISQIFKMDTLNVPSDDNIACIDENSFLVQMMCESSLSDISHVEAEMMALADDLSNILVLSKEAPSAK